MKYKAIAAGMLAASLLAYPVSSLAETKKFTDVPDNAFSKDAIYYLVEKNVISGMTDSTFAPQGLLTRAQAATIVAKAIELKINPAAKPSFNDSKNHWAAPFIAAIEKENIIAGRGSGVFDPEGKVTRAEMASMLVKAYKLKDLVKAPITNKFTDLEGHFGKEAANILVALEISAGTGAKTWSPDLSIPREQAAQMTYKADKLKKNGNDISKPEDTKKEMYIDRKFITYHQPSLSSGITDVQHEPQKVVVKEERDGWIKIVTSKGDKWTPLKEKTEVIKEEFTTYAEASHSSKVLAKRAAQTVTVIEEKDSWIRIRTNSGFQWLDKNQLNPVKQGNFLEGKAIIIDPGHGGEDPGHLGVNMDESAIVLDTSLRVQKLFEKKTPFTVLLTRTDDTRPGVDSGDSLRKRVEFANKNNGDIFVSIHANGYNNSVEGTETYYYRSATPTPNPNKEESRILAEKVQKRLVNALETNNRGVKTDNFYVIKYNTMPAILTELGFIDAKSEGEKLSSEQWRQRAAEAIYQGILDYYEVMGNNVSSFR
ncbi:amidase [Bacillus cereus]|uniref:N-acetylmuramoyl-L-alanine amidase n=1 Tax=Bacillus cereus group TaxID=86661 RepID=UPI0001A027E3|nr:N-acetylmuramoyl-L-alanine amidase [Bacillus cereus]EEK80305.1 Uncharacterized cell wall amidase [Bacillus cereus R309803]PFW58374.1 amidase [Bacillus cereus]PGZ61827.1 amidase [Bacillus cereus]HDR4563023.1 N-acetylmuramoyl-L-alanine amidase [Bacillus luti]